MIFRIKGIEDLEGKEKWESVFFHMELHMDDPINLLIRSWKKAHLETSVWEDIKSKLKPIDGVFLGEFDTEWLSNTLIPEIETNLNKMEGKQKTIISSILRIAKTCVKHRKPMELVI